MGSLTSRSVCVTYILDIKSCQVNSVARVIQFNGGKSGYIIKYLFPVIVKFRYICIYIYIEKYRLLYYGYLFIYLVILSLFRFVVGVYLYEMYICVYCLYISCAHGSLGLMSIQYFYIIRMTSCIHFYKTLFNV